MKWKSALPAAACLFSAIVIATSMATIQAASKLDLAKQGREIFDKRCSGCHSMDLAKAAPALRGVFGRRVGADPRYPSSDALKNAKFVWDEIKLDRWLADPERVVPDNDMPFRLESPAERAAVIEFLKQNASGRQ